MTISAHSLSNDAGFEAPAAPQRDAKRTADRAQLDLETCRRELRAAIEWFKRMRDGWRRTPCTGDSQVERAPDSVDRVNGAGPQIETPVTKAPATEATPPAGNVGELRQTTAIELAKDSPRRGVLAWFKRALSQLTAVWKTPLAAAVAPVAAYFVVGGLVYHVMG